MNEQPDTELWEPVKTNLLKRKERILQMWKRTGHYFDDMKNYQPLALVDNTNFGIDNY
jgi:hypothetical protein